MSKPSQYVRVSRTTEYALKKDVVVRVPGKIVTAGYYKKHPRTTTQSVVYRLKRTTTSYRKGEKVTAAYAKRYRRLVVKTTTYRTKAKVKIIRSEQVVSAAFARHHRSQVKQIQYIQIEERQVVFDPVLRKQTYGDWRMTSRERLNYYERILSMKELTSRHIRSVLSANRIFSNIWQNHKGVIRVTVNGFVGGEHVKDVAHIGYLKSVWTGKHNGYSRFKDYVVNKILQSLRRHRLRVSNPEESKMRLVDLHRKLKDAYTRLDSAPSWNKATIEHSVKEIKKLIRQQKQTRQLTGGTIRIEKLVPN